MSKYYIMLLKYLNTTTTATTTTTISMAQIIPAHLLGRLGNDPLAEVSKLAGTLPDVQLKVI